MDILNCWKESFWTYLNTDFYYISLLQIHKFLKKLLYIWFFFISLGSWRQSLTQEMLISWFFHCFLGDAAYLHNAVQLIEIFFQANDTGLETGAFLILLWDSWDKVYTTYRTHFFLRLFLHSNVQNVEMLQWPVLLSGISTQVTHVTTMIAIS